MKLLEDRIRKEGIVLPHNVLKVDSFLNHQVDPELMFEVGKEFAKQFADKPVTKILTVESSGIAPAVMTGLAMHVPVVFARKHKSLTLTDDLYTADVFSYTKQTTNKISIAKRFIKPDDSVLIIDDFLANGQAVEGLLTIIDDANIKVQGIGIVIEKTFQKGRALITKRKIPLVALAQIASLENGQVQFVKSV
ncbi:Xanthine phosphoribosyltransferase [Pediococcus damnosus]|uniref:Xanthine phosphoribosyltransferase n=1 Tax=Pediococcus damnosus TaxID=51663 RepID=A0A0R2HGU4_9LACO|nr:xanthine phosphoribosyltransferase [Pediococcus damnosus]AMV61169.1 Xanthine phosphoribosyltransferase [Pediococcus damnosus]AMV61793.1 Xanthine phosphoribosyltransferase [Pediococcus damnosus]AMV65528.1 Xanthine phosphoribosyltransferase [Pediococcus damnosus]AMV66332.1 Xanthine phosphoribosyltransferase [Pediococcus damnosus]AMV68632.1 Xanthine phosphoribosyltransferase [Pediococcus damnosus]